MTVAKHFALRSCPLPLMGNQLSGLRVGEFFGVGYYPVATGTWYTRAVQDDVMSAWWVMPFERNCTITLTNYGGTAGGDIQGCCS